MQSLTSVCVLCIWGIILLGVDIYQKVLAVAIIYSKSFCLKTTSGAVLLHAFEVCLCPGGHPKSHNPLRPVVKRNSAAAFMVLIVCVCVCLESGVCFNV